MDIFARWNAKKQEKGVWLNHWDELSRIMLPGQKGFTSQVEDGDSLVDRIYDGTPMLAARQLANTVGGLLRPDGERWFKMRAREDEIDNTDEAMEWFGRVEDEMRDEFTDPKSRFRQATGEADLDLVVLGTLSLFAGERRNLGGMTFKSMSLRDVTPIWDNDGNLEGLFREVTYKISDIAKLRDIGFFTSVSDSVQQKINNKKHDDKVPMLHAIIERPNGRRDALLAKNMLYTDEWYEISTKHKMRESGYAEMPCIVARWDTKSGEDWGRSPGMIALPDANTLQAIDETILISGQRAADPPLMVPNDGSFSEINAFPGGVTPYDVETAIALRGNPFFTLESGTNLPLSRDIQQDKREQVFAAFLRDIFSLPLDRPEMTATEVIERTEDNIRQIGPVFGRLEADYTAPIAERTFNVLLRAGRFPPMPRILEGQSVLFEYDSPVKRIRERAQAQATAIWVNAQMSRAQVNPEVLDNIDFDAVARYEARVVGVPQTLMNGRDRVQQIREARAQQQEALRQQEQQAQQIETIRGVADTGSQVVERLRDAS